MLIISLLLLASLLPHMTFTAHVKVGIVNGKEAKPHSRPYMVSIQKNGKHLCGGFLISDKFVLTAAHCRTGSEILTVVVGAHNQRNNKEGAVRIEVQTYYRHLDFTKDPSRNDIMLLRLERPVQPNENVNWIAIPTKEEDVKENSVCSVAGWGNTEMNGNSSPVLMETFVMIMNNEKCKENWKREFLPAQMMCVYGSGGSCGGDSGGPLVCGKTAVGVTSYGFRNLCNSPTHPNVYTKISAFLPWINNILEIGNDN